jgi:hypothetical protein
MGMIVSPFILLLQQKYNVDSTLHYGFCIN